MVHVLLEEYMKSFHWYIQLFHEPTFRNELDPIISSGLAHASQKPFLMLLLAMSLITAPFCGHRIELGTSSDVTCYSELEWMVAIEQNLLSSFDDLQVPYLGCLFIMTMVYLQKKKTALALSLVAMMVRAAQSIGLHREETWPAIGETERNVRRMVWWAIVMSDG